MFEQFSEQFQSAMKPANSLLAMNIQTFEKLTQHSTTLMSDLVNDTMTYTKGLSTHKDLNSYMEANKALAENLQEKITAAAKDTYTTLSEAQTQALESWKQMFNQSAPVTKAKPSTKA